MTTHSSILAWKIPWTDELGGLQSMGLQRIRHNWATEQQQYSIVYVYYIFFIHLSINGHLGCFHVLVIVDSAAVNIEIQVSF